MNQYAHVPQNGKTIHSAIQLESFGTKVDDRSLKLKQGTQTVSTLNGYVIPLNFVNGLAYMPIQLFMDKKWDNLPHKVLTADVEWDPSMADCKFDTSKNWFDTLKTHKDFHSHEPFNCSGRHVIETNWHDTHQQLIADEIDPTLSAQASIQKPAIRDYEDL